MNHVDLWELWFIIWGWWREDIRLPDPLGGFGGLRGRIHHFHVCATIRSCSDPPITGRQAPPASISALPCLSAKTDERRVKPGWFVCDFSPESRLSPRHGCLQEVSRSRSREYTPTVVRWPHCYPSETLRALTGPYAALIMVSDICVSTPNN